MFPSDEKTVVSVTIFVLSGVDVELVEVVELVVELDDVEVEEVDVEVDDVEELVDSVSVGKSSEEENDDDVEDCRSDCSEDISIEELVSILACDVEFELFRSSRTEIATEELFSRKEVVLRAVVSDDSVIEEDTS